jgi:hypothetical protein
VCCAVCFSDGVSYDGCVADRYTLELHANAICSEFFEELVVTRCFF